MIPAESGANSEQNKFNLQGSNSTMASPETEISSTGFFLVKGLLNPSFWSSSWQLKLKFVHDFE